MSKMEEVMRKYHDSPDAYAERLDAEEERRNREKAAKQWIAHWKSINDYIEQLKAQNVTIESEQELINEVIKIWDQKKQNSDSQIAQAFL